MTSDHKRRTWLQIFLVGYIALTIILAGIGLRLQYPGLPLVDYGLRVFQLFSTYGVGEPDRSARSLNGILLLARAMAGLVAMATVLEVLRRTLGERWTAMRLRWARDHVIICGLGLKGRRLAENLRVAGETVVGIDSNAQADNAAAARHLGVYVLSGDATEAYMVERAHPERAGALVAFSGSDRANVEIAMLACATQRASGVPPLQCAVHIANRRHRELLQQSGLFHASHGCETHFFNVDELMVRRLLSTSVGGGMLAERAHLIIVNFGSLGESLVLQHAHLAHFPGGAPPRVTVVTPDAQQRGKSFQARHPHVFEVCEVEFVDCDLTAAELGAIPTLDSAKSGDGESLVVVAGEEDATNLFTALELVAAWPQLVPPVYVRLRETKGLAALAKALPGSGHHARLIPFGGLETICTREIIFGERLDRLARGVHERYRQQARARGEGEANNPSTRAWEVLSEDLREANRRQADHHELKLRSIGARVEPLGVGEPTSFSFSDEEIDLLARTEHARWCAERRLAGWVYGPERQNELKIHDLLVPWEQLGEENREKDRDVIVGLPELLKSAGYKILR